MDEAVGGDRPIRTKSVGNVDTDRLSRRLEHLRDWIPRSGEWAEQKGPFGDRVRETVNVERELKRRNVEFKPVTNGEHLKVDVHAVPKMGPRPSKKERGL
jgi:hypothetical protein